jgi:glycosyltransferase involved in cell wall biosynthesis
MVNKKKILIFSTAYFPFVGGAEIAIKEITDRLKDSYEFDLITARLDPKLPKIENIGNVRVYRVGTGKTIFDKLLLPFKGALLARRLNKTQNYFCFWGMMATFGTGAAYICNILRWFAGKEKIPMVLTLQEGDSEAHLTYRWFGLIAISWKMALRRTDILTAISTFLLKRAEKNGYTGKKFLVPNGVNLPVFSKEIPREIKNSIKNILSKKNEDIFLVTTGRLTYKNALDDVISALPLLPNNVIFIIIGKGEEGHKLQRQANDLGVANRVKFLGFIPYEEIPNYFSICDIFIRPSRSEGFGNSFIEAMAAGIPVVATPVGGIPDFIDDKETGIFCSPDNPKSIADKVAELIENQSLRSTIIEKARNRVVERYGWEKVSADMKKVFDLV